MNSFLNVFIFVAVRFLFCHTYGYFSEPKGIKTGKYTFWPTSFSIPSGDEGWIYKKRTEGERKIKARKKDRKKERKK